MWPLPEPTRPAGATGWDPPVLVRLELDHGLDRGLDRPGHDRRVPEARPRTDRRAG